MLTVLQRGVAIKHLTQGNIYLIYPPPSPPPAPLPSEERQTFPHTFKTLNHLTFILVTVEGRRHDSGMLAESGLLQELQHHGFTPAGHPLCLYDDPEGTPSGSLQRSHNNTTDASIQCCREHSTDFSGMALWRYHQLL